MQTLPEVCARHNLAPPPDPIPGGVYRLDDPEKPGQGDGYLYLFADGLGGFIQNHRNEDNGESWFYGGQGLKLTADQKRELKRQREAANRQREVLAAVARDEVLATWSLAAPCPPDHPYLARKGAQNLAPLARVVTQVPAGVDDRARRMVAAMRAPVLMLPIVDVAGNLVTTEYVGADGDKRYHPSGRRDGGLMAIMPCAWGDGPVYVCEGASTGASIAAATGRCVVVAFDAGNLPKVALAVRQASPEVALVIAADDDVSLERAGKGNKGVLKAEEAAFASRALCVLRPNFTSLAERGNWSDFNDVHALLGLDALRSQLDPSNRPSRQCPPWLKNDPLDEIRPDQVGESDLSATFCRLLSDRLRYVKAWGRWLEYDAGCWEGEETQIGLHLADELCREVVARHLGGTKTSALKTAKIRASVLQIAGADRRIAARARQWDRDPWLLCAATGVVDLRTGDLIPHRADYYMTKRTTVAPNRKMAAPRWYRFLNEITFGDRALQAYLRRLAGYCLTGDVREQHLTFLYGEGANGKGTFVRMLQLVAGSYHKTSPIEVFMKRRNEAHLTELANLQGARVVTSQEVEEGETWSQKRVKALTGGDTISARFMRGDLFEFEPTHKLLIAANQKPRFSSVDHAIRRRLHLVPFLAKFEGLAKDDRLEDKLRAEAPAILSWAIEGCLEWQSDGLAPPESVRAATREYLDAEDLEKQWIDEQCVRDPAAETPLSALFASWVSFSSSRHGRQGRDRDLSDRLQREGFHKRKTMHGAVFSGIRLYRPGEQHGNVVPFLKPQA